MWIGIENDNITQNFSEKSLFSVKSWFFVKSWFSVKLWFSVKKSWFSVKTWYFSWNRENNQFFFFLQLHFQTPTPHPQNGTPTKCWWILQSIEVCVLWIFSWEQKLFRENEDYFEKVKNFSWNLKVYSVEIYGFFAIQNF